MNRVTLNDLYLDEVKRSGATARELIGRQAESAMQNAFYKGQYLSRPLFLGADECQQLYADLECLRAALVSLPDRLYGGDLAAFSRAVGMADVQISAILRSRGITVTKQSRADLYIDETGRFRLLEFNMGSGLGGMDNSDIARTMLEHPVLAEFAETHSLTFADTLREQVNNTRVESGFGPGSRPMMVITDWPSSFKVMEPYMRHYVRRFGENGFDADACHIGQLEVRDERVWLGDRPVDIINRLFMLEDLLEYPDAPALMDPILDAAHRGWVKFFTPMDAGLFSAKGALAMLSDEENRSRFTAGELASMDRILPWTRMVRPGPVTLEDGRRVDLLDYALAHRRDLALKPTALHGGHGILLGWTKDTTDQMWEEQVRAALDGPYILQRRIQPVPEMFPGEDGEPVPWIVAWGAFTVVNGYGGVFARASTVESNVEVINVAGGAHVGSCLHVRPDAG
ncbi:MAG TPA: hypothetical protein VGL63_11900 [Streptosporangiaceae bacterium]